MQLRQSEVDTAGDPKTLALIGWGPKAGSRAADPPGQPRGLTVAQEDGGSLTLVWKAPPPGDGVAEALNAVAARIEKICQTI